MNTANDPSANRPSRMKWGLAVFAALLIPFACTAQRVFEVTAPAALETITAASEVIASARQMVASAQEALQPFNVTRDPEAVQAWLMETFQIEPAPEYVGAFGLKVQLLGQKVMQLSALIPKHAKAEEIFQGGKNEIRFSTGPHTIFLAARLNKATPADTQEAFAEMEQADRKQPYERVFIEAGGKRVAALRGAFERHGQWNTAVAVFLDNGRVLYATGPRSGFDEGALVNMLTSLVRVNPADDLLYTHATAQPRRVVNKNDPCGIPGLNGDFDVVAISVQRGSVESNENIDLSGERAGQEAVVVGRTPHPVVLVLIGESPVVWTVRRTGDARIAGLLAQGRYRQAVLGLPASIPLTSYSSSDGVNACPYFLTSDRATGGKPKAQARVTELFGRGIDQLITKKANQRFQVGEITGELVHDGSLDAHTVALPDTVMPGGHAGLEWLIDRQRLRVAKPGEIATWQQGFEARTGGKESVRFSPVGGQEVYVLQEATKVPYLAGSNSRVFIVPEGLPLPRGDRGHSTFLMMDGFTCRGPMTACEM